MSPTLKTVLKDGFGEAVTVCYMPKPCKLFPMTVARKGSCRPTRKLTLLYTKPLVLCSKQEVQRSFLRHLVSKAWILFFRVSKQGPCFTAIVEDGGNKRLGQLELARQVDGVTSKYSLAIATIAEAILMWTCIELLPGTWNWSSLLTSGCSC